MFPSNQSEVLYQGLNSNLETIELDSYWHYYPEEWIEEEDGPFTENVHCSTGGTLFGPLKKNGPFLNFNAINQPHRILEIQIGIGFYGSRDCENFSLTLFVEDEPYLLWSTVVCYPPWAEHALFFRSNVRTETDIDSGCDYKTSFYPSSWSWHQIRTFYFYHPTEVKNVEYGLQPEMKSLEDKHGVCCMAVESSNFLLLK